MTLLGITFPRVTLSKNFYTCYQSIRSLPRWQHRRAVRVINAEDYDEVKDAPKKKVLAKEDVHLTDNWKPNFKSTAEDKTILNYKLKPAFKKTVKPLVISKKKDTQTETTDMLELTIDNEGNFIYTKMNNNDPRISSIMVEVKSKKEKETKDLILLEGKRLIKEALLANCKLDYILFSRMKELEFIKPYLPKIGTKLYKMPYREMQLWSDLTTNPGIMGLFKKPDMEAYVFPTNTLPITVICDNIREAGNLGALLRTCSGVGCEEIILTKGCVNVWDSKVLRAACGAHFHIKISKKQDWKTIKDVIKDSKVYIADNNSMPSEFLYKDSLELISSIPIIPYYGVKFDKSERIFLIAGGETEGISIEAYKLAKELNGVRLNIPLNNNIESLNTGTALGIISFEMKRQMLSKT